MSRVCIITGKGTLSGNTRSHSLRATRRKWKANLQPVKLVIDGKVEELKFPHVLLNPQKTRLITKEGKSILPFYYSSLFSGSTIISKLILLFILTSVLISSINLCN